MLLQLCESDCNSFWNTLGLFTNGQPLLSTNMKNMTNTNTSYMTNTNTSTRADEDVLGRPDNRMGLLLAPAPSCWTSYIHHLGTPHLSFFGTHFFYNNWGIFLQFLSEPGGPGPIYVSGSLTKGRGKKKLFFFYF